MRSRRARSRSSPTSHGTRCCASSGTSPVSSDTAWPTPATRPASRSVCGRHARTPTPRPASPRLGTASTSRTEPSCGRIRSATSPSTKAFPPRSDRPFGRGPAGSCDPRAWPSGRGDPPRWIPFFREWLEFVRERLEPRPAPRLGRSRGGVMTATEGIVVLLGRVLFAVFFVRSGIAHVRKHEGMTGYARSAGLPFPGIGGWPAGVWLLAGAASIALGIWAEVGSLMIALFLVLAALYFHRFWMIQDEGHRQTQAGNFYRNVALLGASLVLWGFFVAAGEAVRFTLTGPLF